MLNFAGCVVSLKLIPIDTDMDAPGASEAKNTQQMNQIRKELQLYYCISIVYNIRSQVVFD